jgi:hypothetical protein
LEAAKQSPDGLIVGLRSRRSEIGAENINEIAHSSR